MHVHIHVPQFCGTLAMLQDTVRATDKLQQIVNDCERFMDASMTNGCAGCFA